MIVYDFSEKSEWKHRSHLTRPGTTDKPQYYLFSSSTLGFYNSNWIILRKFLDKLFIVILIFNTIFYVTNAIVIKCIYYCYCKNFFMLLGRSKHNTFFEPLHVKIFQLK